MENKVLKIDNASHDIEDRYDYLLSQYKEFLETHSLEIYSHDSEPPTRWEIIESCNGESLEKIIEVLLENRKLFNHWFADEDFKRLLHDNRNAYLLLVEALVKGNRTTLDRRIKDYHDNVEKLDEKSLDVQSERTASAILTCYNPDEYALYMDQVYKNMKVYLNFKITKEVGEQYSTYLEMLQPIVARIEKDKDLSSKLFAYFDDNKPSVLQLAQEVCWTYFNEQQRKKYGIEKLNYTLGNVNIKTMESSLVTTYKSFLLKNHNMIFTGAPGTGKTFLAKQIAASIIGCDVENLKGNKQFGFVQFHPSYDYTDFVEGLRPSEDESKEFELRQGIFKQFCASALENAESKDFEEAYTKLLDDLENMDEPMSVVTSKSTFGISLNSRGNLNLHTGKNMQKNGVLVREALEATANGQPSYKYWQCYYKGVIELLKGKYGLVITETKKRKNFVFIIDEINRGEISKIFGELFFSIDPGYRGETGIVKTQYQNMVTDGPFMDGFYVPDNVYIIGTMNDIDRSVETLDFAFRRRFPSIEIAYEDTLGDICSELDVADAKEHLKSLNKVISEDENLGLGSEYCIGGAYLLMLKDVDYRYEDLWKFYIEPVIAEYFRGLPSLERKANIDTLKKAFLTKSNEAKNDHEE